MITQMKKYTFLVFHREYEAFLEQLREVGVVHITEKAAGMADDAHLQELLAKAENTRKIIAQGATDQLLTEKANIEQRIAATQKEAARMALWGDFSAERLEQLRAAGYILRYFSCAKKLFQEEWGIVVAEEGADKAAIEKQIKEMPNYFADYDTTVHFITEEELLRDHSGIPHGGFVIRAGKTGANGEHTHVIEYSLKLDSNPEFTGSVLTACARAAYRLAAKGDSGCKTVFDIPPACLSPLSEEELRRTLL